MRRPLAVVVPVGMLLVVSCGRGSESSVTSPVPTSGVATTATVPDSTSPGPPVTTTPATTAPIATLPTSGEITVASPREGDPWIDPMVLAGTASTFEATVNFQVVAADGAVLQEGVTMATCGSGCVGTFAVQLDPLPAGAATPVTVRVFDISEADGSVIDLVEVHVG